jgi:hypothetical protein
VQQTGKIILAVTEGPGDIREGQRLTAMEMDILQQAGHNGGRVCPVRIILQGKQKSREHIITEIRKRGETFAFPEQLMKTVGEAVECGFGKKGGQRTEPGLDGVRTDGAAETDPVPAASPVSPGNVRQGNTGRQQVNLPLRNTAARPGFGTGFPNGQEKGIRDGAGHVPPAGKRALPGRQETGRKAD